MTLSRRQFLRVGGGAALATTIGCDDRGALALPRWLRADADATDGPFRAPSSTEIDPIAHALNRLTFGTRPGDYARARALGRDAPEALAAFVDLQLNPASIDDRAAEYRRRRFETLDEPPGELFEYHARVLLDEMTSAAVISATYSERQLYEVMVRFWTDHFNIDVSKGDCRWLKAADERLVIREHALGKFPALLRASATSPAMLWYLDGRDNQRASPSDRPNENYARELLELHTLGVHGGYTQRDVMEVARALTGWTVRSTEILRKGAVEFHPERHDDGAKDILGTQVPPGLGEADLDRVLSIVALHPATAQHLATKLCRHFIADEPPPLAVARVAEAFTTSDGDIRGTLRALFGTPEFLAARGTKLKRPFHYLVSALRATDAHTDAARQLTDHLSRMGEAPYQYPSPDGYPDIADPWTASLLWRWNFAVALAGGQIAGTRVDDARLVHALGDTAGVMAHFLGRQATPDEARAYRDSGDGVALMLASPGFQRY